MKHFLLLALAALAFFVVAPSASAVRVRVVDAPDVDCTGVSACPIIDPSVTYEMSFLPVDNALCQSATADPPGADIGGFNWCIVFTNFSQTSLTALNFSFTVPAQGSSDYSFLECEGFPASVTNSFCPPAPLHAGDNISMSFSANPGVPNGQAAYLFVDFDNSPETTKTTFAFVSVPEPGALGLFGLGLLAIGYGLQKRRRAPRINAAA